MNTGSQPHVNSSCCLSNVALAKRNGTTREPFIPRVLLLTVGSSEMVAGKISFSSVASSSLFTNSKLFFHAGILRISCPFAVRGFRFQNLGYISIGPSRFPPSWITVAPGSYTPPTRDHSPSQRALYYSFVPLAPLVNTSSAPSHPTHFLSSRALLNGGMLPLEGTERHT